MKSETLIATRALPEARPFAAFASVASAPGGTGPAVILSGTAGQSAEPVVLLPEACEPAREWIAAQLADVDGALARHEAAGSPPLIDFGRHEELGLLLIGQRTLDGELVMTLAELRGKGRASVPLPFALDLARAILEAEQRLMLTGAIPLPGEREARAKRGKPRARIARLGRMLN